MSRDSVERRLKIKALMIAGRNATVPLAFAGLVFLATSVQSFAFEQQNAERIKTLVDTGMQYYWTGGDVKKAEAEIFKGITLHGRYDVVEQSFAEASKLAPERLDFRFAVASSQIL
ncbi:MAG TPA: hypothetical protein VK602_05785 [Phyllobacterium sp.]|nr:hypothetical protein [Phyllobacterium sp.]